MLDTVPDSISKHQGKPANLPVIQIGEGWFSDRGGGLNRYYADLIKHLPSVGVTCCGLVVGSNEVAAKSQAAARVNLRQATRRCGVDGAQCARPWPWRCAHAHGSRRSPFCAIRLADIKIAGEHAAGRAFSRSLGG